MVIVLDVTEKEIEDAKRVTAEFDEQKTHEKFDFKGNWIGYLGELKLNQYFEEHNISCPWVTFVKEGTDDEDFKTTKGKTIDIKTSWSPSLKIRNTKFDYYICALFVEDRKELRLLSWATGKQLQARINNGNFIDRETYKEFAGLKAPMKDINQDTFKLEVSKW